MSYNAPMLSDEDKEKRGVLEILLQLHKALTRIELVIFPVVVAIGVVTGFYRPFVGVCVFGIMLLMTLVYLDARKHRSNRNTKGDP